jgi:hypothetical protein
MTLIKNLGRHIRHGWSPDRVHPDLPLHWMVRPASAASIAGKSNSEWACVVLYPDGNKENTDTFANSPTQSWHEHFNCREFGARPKVHISFLSGHDVEGHIRVVTRWLLRKLPGGSWALSGQLSSLLDVVVAAVHPSMIPAKRWRRRCWWEWVTRRSMRGKEWARTRAENTGEPAPPCVLGACAGDGEDAWEHRDMAADTMGHLQWR